MRLPQSLLLAFASFVAIGFSPAAGDEAADSSVRKLHVVTDVREADGTCVLIQRDTVGPNVVLYFLTSGHLFRGPDDQPPPNVRAVRVFIDHEQTIDVGRDAIFLPGGALLDVVIVRATVAAATIAARPVSYEPPSIGDVFRISGYGADGAPAAVAERVRFKSTLLTVGDRDASTLAGCVGAPAISQKGLFGIVSECGVGRAPVVVLLSMAQSFIERHVPRPASRTTYQARPL